MYEADTRTSFILEGIPAVLVGILIWFYLPDYPETAKFLSDEEKEFAAARMGPFAPKGRSSPLSLPYPTPEWAPGTGREGKTDVDLS